MRNVSVRESFDAFKKFFNELAQTQAPLVVWQLSAGGERIVHRSQLTELELDEGFLHVSEHDDQGYAFEESGIIYCYSETSGVIFKSRPMAIAGVMAQIKLPDEIIYLEDEDIYRIKGSTGVDLSTAPWKVKRLGGRSERDEAIFSEQLASITLSEEDKLFADKREAPRARPKVDKIVTCEIAGDQATSQNFKLFDLSRGGLGIHVLVDGVFHKGSYVHITAMEGQELDQPLIGEVMSVRDLAPEDVGWKVGLKFIDKIPAKT
ncbi:MAG: PilZ domain-containing protein [Bacteriovoracia bacterium]